MTNYFGWQPSLLLSDMTGGTVAGAMNLHMNQALADMQARSTLYMTPTMNWNCFTPYSASSGGMDYLLDPNYTVGQWQWNQNNNNGSIWGGGAGSMGMPQMNWNNNFNSPFNNPWGFGNNNGTTPTAGNKTEKAFQTKYQKLEKIVKALISDESPLTGARKEELKSTLSAREGKTWKEKFENLKDAYNEVPKSDIKEFLASEAADGLSINGKDAKTNSFFKNLLSAGYDFEDTDVDDQILTVYNRISSISDKDANPSSENALGNLKFDSSAYEILDLLSSWNNAHKNVSMIDLFGKQYSKMKDATSKETAVANVLTPLVSALTSKASKLVKELDSASQTKLKKSIDELNNAAKFNNGNINFTQLSKAFNKLYLQTRLASIDILRANIRDYYGSIDEEVFGDKTLFEAETIKDLRDREGFSAADIKNAKLSAKVSNDKVREDKYDDEDKTAKQQLEELKTDGYLAKATATGISGDVYYDKNTNKVYVIKKNDDDEEEIHEVKDVKAKDGKVNVTGAVETKKVTASDIASESEKIKEEAADKTEKAKAAQKVCANKNLLKPSGKYKGEQVYEETNGSQRRFVVRDGEFVEIKKNSATAAYEEGETLAPEDIEAAHENAITQKENTVSAYSDGQDALKKLDWDTDSKYYTGISSKLSELNKDTVLTYVQGFYDAKGSSPEGMIEHLDDEWDSGNISMDSKKNLINSFLEKAKELGFEKDDDYKAIQEIMQYYEPGQEYAESKTFNHANGGYFESIGKTAAAVGGAAGAIAAFALASNPIGWVVGGIGLASAAVCGYLDRRTDNEVIDECMKSLMEKMQAKFPKEFHQA